MVDDLSGTDTAPVRLTRAENQARTRAALLEAAALAAGFLMGLAGFLE